MSFWRRKLFEFAAWLQEPMVPKRLMDDRLDRQRRLLEETATREARTAAELIGHLRREVARLERMAA